MTRTLDHLETLIAARSVFTEADYTAITDYCETVLKAVGAQIHRIESPRGGRAGLFASIGPAGSGGLLLSGHLDVVPVEGQNWSSDPFRLTRRDGLLYGRGTCDMKGFVACALAAAERAAQGRLSAPLKLALSYDEEAGCVGIAEMAPHLAETVGPPDLCLVGEPSLMRLIAGHKGKASWRIVCEGEAGHSSGAPLYANAMHMAADALAILRALQTEIAKTEARDAAYALPYTTIHAGTLRAGNALNIVPDRAEMAFEIRHLAATDLEALRARIGAEIAALADRWRAAYPAARIRIEDINRYPGLEASAEHPGVARLIAWGAQTPMGKVDFGTEAGAFAGLGIPTWVCGPGSIEQAHKANEFVAPDQLAQCDAMLDRGIDWLRG